MSDSEPDSHLPRAPNGHPYALGDGPGSPSPPIPPGHDAPDGTAAGIAHSGPVDEQAGPTSGAGPTPPYRKAAFRLGSSLDRGFWIWIWVIGAIVLITLIIVAVSQLPSTPKKGMDARPVARPGTTLTARPGTTLPARPGAPPVGTAARRTGPPPI